MREGRNQRSEVRSERGYVGKYFIILGQSLLNSCFALLTKMVERT
jgi:hypothetical protein